VAHVDTQRRRGWAFAAIGMLLVSTDTLFIRLAEASAWDVAFLVAVFSLPIYIALAWKVDHRATPANVRRYLLPLLLVGVLSGVTQTAFIGAVNRTTVANVATIVAAVPLVAAFVGWFLFDEVTSRRVWIAIGATIAGMLIVVTGSLGSPTLDGDALALLAVLAFGLALNVWRRFPDMSVYVGLTLSAVVMLAMAAQFASPLALDARAYLSALAMGAVFNPLGRIFHTTAPRYAPASEVALFTPIETVAATTWAWIAFSEVPPGQTVLGAAVIIAGVLYGTALAGR